ncbi:MAG: substrate-binding domain-containing protein [Oscillospiraceae bacterium]|nr:substrate-binding domain-containing protein [Oscillospiraceae bacterium]
MKKLTAVFPAVLSLVVILSLTACGSAAGSGFGDSQSASQNQAPNTASSARAAAPDSAAGKAPGFDTSKNISVTAREDGSGTKSAFMEIIGLKGKADPENVIIQNGTAGILAEVKGNPAAIAYESLGYVTSDVKMLKVDGAEATTENIKSGVYKISRPLSIVYKEAALDNAVNSAFFTFLQSSDAQVIISAEGYVSTAENAPAYTINASLSGSIDISGSTSLQPLMTDLAAAFEVFQPNVSVTVGGGGSGTGYKNADEGVSEFGMISEEFSIEKAPSCVHTVVCKDGIAVIVHKDNPLDSISAEQLKNIYDVDAEAGAVTKWHELIK